MNHLKIKQIGISELFQLQKISKHTFIETFEDKNSEENMLQYLSESLSLERLALEIENPNSQFYFAILKKTVVGYLKINLGEAQTEYQNKNTLEVERVYVLKEFQGIKVGQLLFNKAISIAKVIEADYLWLGVWEENLKAINFYKKNGLEAFGQHKFMLGNDVQTDILMKLKVNN
jgi:ribosomal protein S18 acetylase RimI-like enzyme